MTTAHGPPTKQTVLETVFNYYQKLKRNLEEHILLEEEHIKPDFAKFTNFYHSQLLHHLEKKVERCKREDELANLIRQASYHLLRVYYEELDCYMTRVKQENMQRKLEGVFHDCDLPQVDKMELVYESDYKHLFLSQNEIDHFAHSWPSEQHMERHTDDDLMLFDPYADQDIARREFEKRPLRSRIYKFISMFLPVLQWLPSYRHHIYHLKDDIVAGLTVGVMLIPQGMAYALIAGLPPIHGMYACLTPLFVYSILGTSRELSVGPTAMCSLIMVSELNRLNASGSGLSTYILYTTTVTFLMGLTQLLMGILRLGFISNFLSYPVVSGFTSAVALQIICSQLSNFTGVSMPSENQLHKIMFAFGKGIHSLHFPTTMMGLCSFLFMYFMANFKFFLGRDLKFTIWRKEYTISRSMSLARIPASLLLVTFGILTMYLVKTITHYDPSHKEVQGIKIVGQISPKLPQPTVPFIPGFNLYTIQKLSTAFLTLALVGFVEVISIAKLFSIQKGYSIDPNQELIAIGMSNLIGSFFQSFPSSGSMPRSAVNSNSGAISPLAGFVSGLLILITITVLTPLFYYLPMCVLAGIIIYSCTRLLDFKQVIFTFKTKKRDFISLLLAFFCSLFIGIKEGVLIAAGTSLVIFILRSTRPRFHIIGRKPGTTQYLEVQKWKDCKEIPGVLVMRFDSDMYFANVSYYTEQLHRAVRKSPYPVYAVVLDCSGTNQADSTAVQTMIDLKKSLDKQGIELFIAQMKRSMRVVMKRGGIYDVIDKQEHFFENLHDAVVTAESITRKKRMAELDKHKEELITDSEVVPIEEQSESSGTYSETTFLRIPSNQVSYNAIN